MSPSELSQKTPPEVLAIAVALAVVWAGAEVETGLPEPATTETRSPSPWRRGGQRWERSTSHRWS